MKNKVYYGEFTLRYWVEMILNKQIELPDYQRLLVWTKEEAGDLIKSFRDNQFVLPVTIGQMNDETGLVKNYILDGQQRLTSILLAYLSIFPKKTKEEVRKLKLKMMKDDDDVEIEEEDLNTIQEWTFKVLLDLGNNKREIMSKVNKELYDDFNQSLNDDFFDTHFLGFSYIVPDKDSRDQQRFYSSVFRNINNRGVKLQEYESRRSLYFLAPQYKDFFEFKFDGYTYEVNGEESFIDFVRYVSFLTQYHHDGSERRIARGYGNRKKTLADYYETYIYCVSNNEDSEMFTLFENIFEGNNYKPRIEMLKQQMESINIPKVYHSIIEIDMYFFGLIYISLFLEKTINQAQSQVLIDKIEDIISAYKAESKHCKSPSAFKYLRERIKSSIDIYREFVI